MPECPPPETPSTPPHPPQSPQRPPNESQQSETQYPNPNPNSESKDPSQNPQPSTPETLNPPPENPTNEQIEPEENPHDVVEEDQEQQDEPDSEPEPEPELETKHPESEGMNNTLSPHHNPSIAVDNHVIAQEIKVSNNINPPASVRKTSKRKKGGKNRVSDVVLERKLQQLNRCFKPIPFVPGKVLDFSRHEEFLKKLGLWDFAHLEFDKNIRADLVAKLIVGYNQKNRGSYVDGFKIGVSRADFGRALNLPKKPDCDVDNFPAEFLSFLYEFVTSWMILHEDEDLWCMPQEIVALTKPIRDGSPQKVDWAGLIWFMVEKELAQRTTLKDCYYATYLQQLIKVQKEELLRDIPYMEGGNPKVEVEISKEAISVEDDEDGGDMKMMDFEESVGAGQKLEDQNVELRLGQDYVVSVENVGDADKMEENSECHASGTEKVEDVNEAKNEGDVGNFGGVDEGNEVENIESAENVDSVEYPENKDMDMMEFEDNMGEEQGQGHWFLGNKIGGQSLLQRCSMGGVKVSDRGFEDVGEDVEDEEVEGDEHVEGFKIMSRSTLDGMTSANLIQAFQTGQLPYSTAELGGQSSLELMSSRDDDNVMLGAPSMFNHAGKREIKHEHDISHHSLNDNKRMRLDGNWDEKAPPFDMCMEQMQYWAEKAKSRYLADTNVYHQANMNQQHYVEQQLADKDNEIMQLNYKLGDLQRSKQAEVDRLNRELCLMSSVIDGYRRALKQTQKSFADYRKRSQLPDESIYKDTGLGGVVKSVMELERERLKQEEENKVMCSLIEETFWKNVNDLQVKWDSEVLAKYQSHDSRLMDAVKEMEQLKDHFGKRKTSANVQDEGQGPSE
ncbi:hypothetical protein SOVF_082680 [Spinacia oleracea]|uniref:Aminotransferase-like plant mobile domain-containing protein n=1 Tax=Spinacia oleracea TaxID=3562 RepID=A0A9R0JSB1_SPIOL|nr:uncharacterized protein LOC110785156 [Spinacia oleracea]KNA17148.1 hypothetical protein SOVF_082680 [Spinacia oleracea]